MAVTGGPLLFVSAGPVMIGILGGLGVLFFIFGLRTWLRQQTCVQVSDEGINTLSSGAPAPRVDLPWNQLSEFNLRYYSTQRDRGDGWLQMLLKSDVAKIQRVRLFAGAKQELVIERAQLVPSRLHMVKRNRRGQFRFRAWQLEKPKPKLFAEFRNLTVIAIELVKSQPSP